MGGVTDIKLKVKRHPSDGTRLNKKARKARAVSGRAREESSLEEDSSTDEDEDEDLKGRQFRSARGPVYKPKVHLPDMRE